MRLLLRFCASCAFLRPSLLVLFAAFAGHLAAQPAPVLADPTTGALYRPGAATFASYNNLLTLDGAAGSYLLISTAASTYLPITVAFNSYQQLDADLTSWAAVVRAGGFDTFVATPSSANLATLVTGETGSGALVFGTSPTFTTPTLGAATATSITAPDSTALTLAGGSTGASLVLGQGTAAAVTASAGNGTFNMNRLSATAVAGTPVGVLDTYNGATFIGESGFSTATAHADSSLWEVWTKATGSAIARAVRITNTQNLLIGTTTDITGTGGLHVAGTATASTTTSGALRVGSNVGLSGNAGGASYFGGDILAGQLTATNGIRISASAIAAESSIFLRDTGTLTNGLAALTGNQSYTILNAPTGGTLYIRRGNDSGPGLTFNGTTAAFGSGAIVTVANTTPSTLTTNGALVVAGGVGVSGAMNVGGAATFAGAVTVAGTVIHTLSATPASASATGTVGTMSWDANYIYICTAANTWKRVAIATW
jgi:hypothetical protein